MEPNYVTIQSTVVVLIQPVVPRLIKHVQNSLRQFEGFTEQNDPPGSWTLGELSYLGDVRESGQVHHLCLINIRQSQLL